MTRRAEFYTVAGDNITAVNYETGLRGQPRTECYNAAPFDPAERDAHERPPDHGNRRFT